MFAKSDAARGPSPPKPRRFIRSGGFAFRQRDGGRLLRLGDGPIPPWPVVLNRSGLATPSVPTERLAVASRMGYFPQLTDDAALTTLCGADVYGGPGNFHIIRDNQILDAVLVSVGRFGVVYSAVLRAAP
jgi:hypothetical protein